MQIGRALGRPVAGTVSALGGPLVALFLVVFCVMTGIGMVFSMLAVYAESLGAGTSVIGLLLGCFGGARLAVNFPAGVASERLGRRPVMLGGLLVLALGSFLAAQTSSVPLLLLCLLAQGAGSSAFVTTALATVADLGTPATRMRDMAAYQGTTLIGISVGPALGGLSVAAWGFGAPFFLQGGMGLIAMLLLYRTRLPDHRSGPSSLRVGKVSQRALMLALAGLLVMTYGVFFVRVGANWVLLPLVAKESLGMSMGAIGLMLTAAAVANLLVLPLTSRLAAQIGRPAVVVGASALTVAILLLLATVHTAPMLWLTAVLLGAASGVAAPTIAAITADAAKEGQLGAAMGLMRTMTDLGIVSGPVVVGLIVDRLGLGYSGGLVAAALVLAASTAVFGIVRMTPARP